MEQDRQDRTKVRIYTDQFMIIGEIAMFADTRLTDFMVGAKSFLAITNAVVRNNEDKMLFRAEFLNVHINKIVVITPEALVKPV